MEETKMRVEHVAPWLKHPTVTEWPRLGGYSSIRDAVRELSRRFPHRNPRPFGDGIEYDGDLGSIVRVTFVHVGVA